MSGSALQITMSVHLPAQIMRLERPLPTNLRHSIRTLDIVLRANRAGRLRYHQLV